MFAYGEGGIKVYNTHTETVTLARPTMTPNFTYSISNTTVTFTNTSTNVGFEEPDAYLWSFGDGTTSTAKNPVKTYAGFQGEAKSFSVTLTTRNIWEQTATVTKTVAFTVVYSIGEYPVELIRLRTGTTNVQYAPGTKITPLMSSFKGLTTDTQSDLLYLTPFYRTDDENITWREADGSIDETRDPLNLTRNPFITPTGQWGLSAAVITNTPSGFKFTGTLSTPSQKIGDFSLDLRDLTIGNTEQWTTVFVDLFTNLGYREYGYFRLGKGPVGPTDPDIYTPVPMITNATRKLVTTRVMPPNYLNFDYTQDPNSRTVRFTSRAGAGSWSWDFGDGTTSTLQNPVKTYSSNSMQTYKVVHNGNTEYVKLRYPIPYGFRWIRLKQKLHDGLREYDTPCISNFKLQTTSGPYVSPLTLTNPQSIGSRRTISSNTTFTQGSTGGSSWDPFNTQNLTNSDGFRVRTQNAQFTSEWDVAIDYKETIFTGIDNITMDALGSFVGGIQSQNTMWLADYEVFVTDYTGNAPSVEFQSNPELLPTGYSWLKIGEIGGPLENPALQLNYPRTYTMQPI